MHVCVNLRDFIGTNSQLNSNIMCPDWGGAGLRQAIMTTSKVCPNLKKDTPHHIFRRNVCAKVMGPHARNLSIDMPNHTFRKKLKLYNLGLVRVSSGSELAGKMCDKMLICNGPGWRDCSQAHIDNAVDVDRPTISQQGDFCHARPPDSPSVPGAPPPST